MRSADALIETIVTASEIPSRKRRLELVRELRSHIAELELAERAAGRSDDEIERTVTERFGDPLQVARNFGWAYRRQRAALRVQVLAISAIAIAAAIIGGVLTLQAAIAAGLGLNFAGAAGSRHTLIEVLDIGATVTAYLAIASLERIFDAGRRWKAIAVFAAVLMLLLEACAFVGMSGFFLVFGAANAVFLRSIQLTVKSRAARFAATVTSLQLFAFLFWGFHLSPASVTSWFVMAAGYQLMTSLASRVDERLSQELRHI